MNTVHVKWFAIYRQATGVAEETVETSAQTAAELFRELAGKHPGLSHYKRTMVAINDQMQDWETALADGDVVLFFPPVSGG